MQYLYVQKVASDFGILDQQAVEIVLSKVVCCGFGSTGRIEWNGWTT